MASRPASGRGPPLRPEQAARLSCAAQRSWPRASARTSPRGNARSCWASSSGRRGRRGGSPGTLRPRSVVPAAAVRSASKRAVAASLGLTSRQRPARSSSTSCSAWQLRVRRPRSARSFRSGRSGHQQEEVREARDGDGEIGAGPLRPERRPGFRPPRPTTWPWAARGGGAPEAGRRGRGGRGTVEAAVARPAAPVSLDLARSLPVTTSTCGCVDARVEVGRHDDDLRAPSSGGASRAAPDRETFALEIRAARRLDHLHLLASRRRGARSRTRGRARRRSGPTPREELRVAPEHHALGVAVVRGYPA